MASKQSLIVIVGPTASGKTALAIEIAGRVGGEIICADSRTVVSEISIGTAKPTADEQKQIPHWGLDLVDPSEQFTAAAFKQYANKKITEIRSRGNIPLLVGGTGLYVDSVVFDYEFPKPMSEKQRQLLSKMSQDELINYCIVNNIELPFNDKNKRHLIRSIAHHGLTDVKRNEPKPGTHMFAVVANKTTLASRVATRARQMFDDGIVDEARQIDHKYGKTALHTFDSVYPGMRQLFDGAITESELLELIESRDRQLAKRQMTWFRRNRFIQWGEHLDILERTTSLFTTE